MIPEHKKMQIVNAIILLQHLQNFLETNIKTLTLTVIYYKFQEVCYTMQ